MHVPGPRPCPVLILDGGLGTTLEDVFHKNISTPLWSAKPIAEDPDVLIAAHLAFLRAGADVILTSTYQCAFDTFDCSREDAGRIMRKGVQLALEAKRRFLEEQAHPDPQTKGDSASRPSPRPVRIALSLGPYGATLSPAQEFDGFYPPPFGPDLSGVSLTSSTSVGAKTKTNAFDDSDSDEGSDSEQERVAIDALTTFHHERLAVFADDRATWDALDYVAFETVPLRRELTAIRRAVARLQGSKVATAAQTTNSEGEGVSWVMKPWWISTVHPNGQFPEMTRTSGEGVGGGGGHVSMSAVTERCLLDRPGEDDGAVPWGFGINCTDLDFLSGRLQEAQDVVRRSVKGGGRRPWLVLYPNRGDVYQPETQTWCARGKEGLDWARTLHSIVVETLETDVWDGVIVGGCCKTGPDEIAALAHAFAN